MCSFLIEEEKWQKKELVQEKLHLTPEYKVVEESGYGHNNKFIMSVYFGERFIAQGEGFSKKEASIAAACNALRVEFKISLSAELLGKNK